MDLNYVHKAKIMEENEALKAQLVQYARLVREMWEFVHPVDRKLFISRPEVKAILDDQQTFIGSESIGVTDEDFEVYYPDEEEG